MTKPRVLIVTTTYPPARGGIERLSQRLAEGIGRLDVAVLALDEPGSEAFDAARDLPIVRIFNEPRGGRRAVYRLAGATGGALSRGRPDVVLSMHIRASYALPVLTRLRRVPYVQYVHAKELTDQPKLARRALGAARSVIAVSGYTATLAERYGAAADRIVRIPPGVDTSARGPAPSTDRPPTLITVARLEDRYKGHDVVMRALPLIRARVPGARWVIVGDGSLRGELEELAREHGLTDAVEFRGELSDADRDRAMRAADAFVMPSRVESADAAGEGFGMVYLEANALGLPVIAGDAGGAVDAVRDGETGLLVDPTSVEAVADAAAALLGDRGRARAFGAAAVAHARTFAWPGIVARVEDVLLQAASIDTAGADGDGRAS